MRRSCLADVKIDVTISNEIKSNVRTPVITILLDFVSKHIADFGPLTAIQEFLSLMWILMEFTGMTPFDYFLFIIIHQNCAKV